MKHNCFCCEKKIESTYRKETKLNLIPEMDLYGVCGTVFLAEGNYGSGVFDPFDHQPGKLFLYICDDCMKKKSKFIRHVVFKREMKILKQVPFTKYLEEEI